MTVLIRIWSKLLTYFQYVLMLHLCTGHAQMTLRAAQYAFNAHSNRKHVRDIVYYALRTYYAAW